VSLARLLSKASILSDVDIKNLIKANELQITDLESSAIGPASIDLHLGPILVQYLPQTITIGNYQPLKREIDLRKFSYPLKPGEFILGMTREQVRIPDGYLGVIETKGNIARAGIQVNGIEKYDIQVHSNDGHIDPGFCGNITLEIVNMHRDGVCIELVPDIFICQLFIGKLSSPSEAPYKGKYLHQNKPTTYLP